MTRFPVTEIAAGVFAHITESLPHFVHKSRWRNDAELLQLGVNLCWKMLSVTVRKYIVEKIL